MTPPETSDKGPEVARGRDAGGRTQRALSGALVFVVQGVVTAVTPFIVAPLLVRVEGRSTLGQFSIVAQILSWILLLDLGITTALTRELAQLFYDDQRREIRDRTVVTGLAFLIAVGLMAALVLAGIAFSAPLWSHDDRASLVDMQRALLAYAAWMPMRFAFSLAPTMLYASQAIARYGAISLAQDLARAVATVAAVAFGYGLFGIALAAIGAEALALVLTVVVSRDVVRGVHLRSRPDLKILGRLMTLGGPLAVMSLADRLTFYSQSLVVATLFDSSAVATFHATRAPGNSAMAMIWRASDSVIPGLNDLYSRGSRAAFRSAFVRLVGYTFGASLLLGVGILVFNRSIVSAWLNETFYVSFAMTLSIAALAPISAFKNVAVKFIIVEGKIGAYTWVILTEGIVNIALSIWLGRLMGPGGVMVAIVIAHVISITYLFMRAARLIEASFTRLASALGGRAVRCAVAGSVVSVLAALIGTDGLTRLILLGGACAVVGALGIILIGLDAPDREALFRSLRRVLRRKADAA